jgi:hypothetical protein
MLPAGCCSDFGMIAIGYRHRDGTAASARRRTLPGACAALEEAHALGVVLYEC